MLSTMNGDIDITFPALVKADIRLKNQMGEIYTDLEGQLKEKTELFKVTSRRSQPPVPVEISMNQDLREVNREEKK